MKMLVIGLVTHLLRSGSYAQCLLQADGHNSEAKGSTFASALKRVYSSHNVMNVGCILYRFYCVGMSNFNCLELSASQRCWNLILNMGQFCWMLILLVHMHTVIQFIAIQLPVTPDRKVLCWN